MTEWTVTVANSEKVLISFVLNVGVDDEGVLVNFVRIGGDASLLCTIRESHHILEKVRVLLGWFHLLLQIFID